MTEWRHLKQAVIAEGYPRDKLHILWCCIAKFHGDSFSNLLKLAAIALTVLFLHRSHMDVIQNNLDKEKKSTSTCKGKEKMRRNDKIGEMTKLRTLCSIMGRKRGEERQLQSTC